jgi:hypothetical protein
VLLFEPNATSHSRMVPFLVLGGATTLYIAVAGNENSITQAQQYPRICLRSKLAVVNNQNHVVVQKGHRPLRTTLAARAVSIH